MAFPAPLDFTVGLPGRTAAATRPTAEVNPVALDLGFSGLSAPMRPPAGGGDVAPGAGDSPLRRMMEARVEGRAWVPPFGDIDGVPPFMRSRSSREVNSAKAVETSAPNACRRAFSCLAWTLRK